MAKMFSSNPWFLNMIASFKLPHESSTSMSS
jgi:hypothetical protein